MAKQVWLLMLLALGCGKKSADLADEGGDADTDADADADADADTDADPPDPKPTELHYTVEAFLTGAFVEGADASYDTQSQIVGVDGQAVISVPPQEVSIVSFELENYATLDHVLSTDNKGGVEPFFLSMMTELSILTMAKGFGAEEPDPTKGALVVSVPLPGTVVSIDATHLGAVTHDKTKGIGVTPGDTVLADGQFVMFINVDPGPVTITLDTPGSETCVLRPSAVDEVYEVEVNAARVTGVVYACE